MKPIKVLVMEMMFLLELPRLCIVVDEVEEVERRGGWLYCVLFVMPLCFRWRQRVGRMGFCTRLRRGERSGEAINSLELQVNAIL